jgi:predicted phage terminase large subunit-like protein
MAAAPSELVRYLTDAELKELEFRKQELDQLDKMTVEQQLRLQYRTQLEASPSNFFREAWPVLEPGTRLADSWHYDYVGEHLESVYRGEIRRLIINVPPRTAKTDAVTICWPAQCWGRNPTLRFLCASYSMDLSRDHSIKRRTLMESEWYRTTWPNVQFSRDTNRQDQYRNLNEGEMIATSVGLSGTTGRGANILILDDGMSADQAKSDTYRKTAHSWYVNTFTRRLNDPANGAIVVVEQRTHDDDITGWLLKNEPGQWTHVVIPLQEETTKTYTYPRSGTVHERMEGDVLQPTRFPPSVIASRKIHVRTFATQDQQKPAPDSGIVFQREWWRYRKVPREKYDQIVTSWDFAVEGNSTSDYNCGICAGKLGADIDILDVVKVRVGFAGQLQVFKAFAAKHPYATRHLVEKKANGPAVIASIKSQIGGVIAVEPTGSKYQRADASTPECEAGNVYLLEGAWNLDFVESLSIFPNGANDDDVDAFGQLVNWLRGHTYSYGLLGYAAQQAAAQAQQAKELMENSKVIKPDTGVQSITCEQCQSVSVVRIGNLYRCNGCSRTWNAVPTPNFDPKIFARNGLGSVRK